MASISLLASKNLSICLYANLTRFPGNPVPSATAYETIKQLPNVVRTMSLEEADYQAALARCAERNLISGIIYDALHLQAAIKAKASALCTANVRAFERLGTRELMELRVA